MSNEVSTREPLVSRGLTRRQMLAGMGAAGAAATMGSVALASPAGAVAYKHAKPLPRPIPGGIDTGVPSVGFIHWWLPGPTDAVTPVLGLGGFGLDVDPSTITDFYGFAAFAVVAGEATDMDGRKLPVEFDVRVMRGRYKGEDGHYHYGAFAFI